MLTTSRIVGRAELSSSTHNIAILNNSTTVGGGYPVSLESTTAATEAAASTGPNISDNEVAFLTHLTISTPSPNSPTGFRPVISSNSTTPKL